MDKQHHLYDLIKDFGTAMLVTHGPGGDMHARPMTVAQLKPNADTYFATSIESPKIAELEQNPRALVIFHGKSQFATVRGVARIVRNRVLIDKLWSESWRRWFPGGKNDPTLCILKIDATDGEYWDTSGLEGLKFAFEGLKAIVQGRQAEKDEMQHAKVPL
jgi:general stress protein 26